MKVFSVYLFSLILLTPNLTQATLTLVPTPPNISADAYLLEDFHSQQTLMEKNADKQIKPASLTKLMTAYLVFEELRAHNIQLTDRVKISEKAWRMPGSRMYLEVDTTVPVEQLLKGMIIQSGNDASVALAEFVAGSEEAFVDLMNNRAQSLGLNHTHYTNSTGLPDDRQYTTARDLAQMTRALIKNFPQYYHWYSEREFTYNNITQSNRNLLLWRDQTVDGVKTGYTEGAGYCLVSSAKRGYMRLISIVMGAESKKTRIVESQKMLDYGFRFFETYQLYKAHEVLNTERIWQGEQDKLQLGLEVPLYVTIPKGQYEQLNATLHVDKQIMAPITAGQTYGHLRITLGEQLISQRPLIALASVNSGHLWKRMVDYVLLLFN